MPTDADIAIDTPGCSPDAAADQIIAFLVRAGYMTAAPAAVPEAQLEQFEESQVA